MKKTAFATTAFSVTTLATTILTYVGFPLAAAWLISRSMWTELAVGVALLLAGQLVNALLMLPSLALLRIPTKYTHNKVVVGAALLTLGLNTLLSQALWCAGVFWFFMSRGAATPEATLPLILMAYSLSVLPFQEMGRKQINKHRSAKASVTKTITSVSLSTLVISILVLSKAVTSVTQLAAGFFALLAIGMLAKVLTESKIELSSPAKWTFKRSKAGRKAA